MWNKHPTLTGLLVSDDGQVARLIPDHNMQGYRQINLPRRNSGTGKGRQAFVHRLVAETFLGPMDGLTVNHKDGDPANNDLSNLELISKQANILHRYRILGRDNQSKLTPEQVADIRSAPKSVTTYSLAQKHGVSYMTASRCRRYINYRELP